MFGFANLFQKNKMQVTHIDGKVDVEFIGDDPNQVRSGGTCSECVWMSGFDATSTAKCNSCIDHKNFSSPKKEREAKKRLPRKQYNTNNYSE